MLAAAGVILSSIRRKRAIHEANHFDFHPLRELTVLFAGIFATMMPVLGWLEVNAREVLGSSPAPGIFFWSSGTLSSLLDNAPTYLAFLSALFGVAGTREIEPLLATHATHIMAISIGSVFFGAATYIGNGPNFMVKAIADQRKIRMPTFFGYIFKFTLPFLLPCWLRSG